MREREREGERGRGRGSEGTEKGEEQEKHYEMERMS